MPQMQLPFFPHGATPINNNVGFIRDENTITYIYGHLPIFQHPVDDIKSFKMITSQMYINGTATQAEISRAFGISLISIKRSVKIYKKKGPGGFFEKKKTRGVSVLTPVVLTKTQELLDEGLELLEVSKKIGVKTDTLRKAVQAGRLKKNKRNRMNNQNLN